MASKFWVGGTGNWDLVTTTHWSTTSGGAGGAAVPVSGDDVFFDANSGGGTVTIPQNLDTPNDVKSLDLTGFTGTITTTTGALFLRGGTANNVTIGATVASVSGFNVSWGSAAIGTLTTNGKTLGVITIGGGSAGGTMTLADNLTSSATIQHLSGTFNTNAKTVNALGYNSSNSNVRTLNISGSAITLTGAGTAWDCTTSTGLTITKDTATSITFTGASAIMATGGKAYNDASFTGSGGAIVANSGCSFRNLTRIGTAVKTDSFAINTNTGNYTVTGTLTITGNSATNRVLFSGPLAASAPVPAAAVSLINVNFKDIAASGAASPWTGTSLGDCGGNTGITFDTPVTAFWVGDTGNYSDTTHWSSTSGGAGSTTRVPLPQDSAKWDANSFSATTKTVNIDMPHVAAMDYSAITKSVTVFNFNISGNQFVYGSIQGHPTNGSFTGSTSTVNTAGRGSFTLGGIGTQSGGAPAMTFNAPGGTYTLTSNIGSGIGGTSSNRLGALVLTYGTLDLAGFSMAFFNFNNTSGNTRSLIFNGGTMITRDVVTSTVWSSASPGLTLSAVGGLIVQDVAIPTGVTLTFTGGGLTYGTLQHTVAGSQGSYTITGSNSFQDLVFSDASNTRTVFLQVGTITTVRSSTPLQSFLGTAGKLMGLRSSAAGTTATIDLPNGYGSSNFTVVQDIVVTTKPWYAGSNSTNGGNNTNVFFSTAVAASGSLSLGGSGTASFVASGTLDVVGSGAAQVAASANAALSLAASGLAAVRAVAAAALALAAAGTAQGPVTATGALSLTASGTARAATAPSGFLSLLGAGSAGARVVVASGALTFGASGTPSFIGMGFLVLSGTGTAKAKPVIVAHIVAGSEIPPRWAARTLSAVPRYYAKE